LYAATTAYTSRSHFASPLYEKDNLKETIEQVTRHLGGISSELWQSAESYNVTLRESDRKKARDVHRDTTAKIFPRISKTALRKHAHEASLLYFYLKFI
jgi:hypothetical protein